jgi:LmbE family N-acetylglucosaminyl deacetylase
MKNKILVVVAHADDEALGCGGTLIKHRDAGDEIRIIFMTDGVGARSKSEQISQEQRLAAQTKVCQQLTIGNFYNFDFPDNNMDSITLIKVVQSIENITQEFQPNIIYTHHGGDLNIDHQVVHRAVMTASRPQPNHSVTKILAFEVNSSTEWSTESIGGHFIPNYFIDISKQITEKERLLEHYHAEMREYPHTRSIEGVINRNKTRGNSVGLKAAEAFMLIREIVF